MNPEQSRQQNNGWTKGASGQFTALMKPRDGQVDPDAPGAKKPVLILRYGFYVPDPQTSEDAIKFIPDKVMSVPYHIAVDMLRERTARFIQEEEAAPLLAKQQEEDLERARQAKLEADMVIAQRKAELGEIPDVTDSQTNAKIEALEATNKQLTDQMGQLLEMQKAFFKQFGMMPPGMAAPEQQDDDTTAGE